MQPANFSFQPNVMAAPQAPAPVMAAQAEGPQLPSKISSHSGARKADEAVNIVNALAASILKIGSSFNEPLKPSEVNPDAPVFSDWKLLADRLSKGVAHALPKIEEKRQKIIADRHRSGRVPTKRSIEGSLVYLNHNFTSVLKDSGILNAPEERNEDGTIARPARQYAYPEDADLAIAKRSSIVSIISALVHKYNLKHPSQEYSSYFHVDHPMMARIFSPEAVQRLAQSIPKSQTEEAIQKKKEKCKKEGKEYKPTKSQDRVKMLPKIDPTTGRPAEPIQMIPWILSTGVIAMQGDFTTKTRPRNLTDEEMQKIEETGAHFVHVTELRNKEQKARVEAEKKDKKKTEVARNIAAPARTNFATLSVNTSFNPVAVQNGQVSFSAPPVQQQPAPVNNFPAGFTPSPGVNFTPQ